MTESRDANSLRGSHNFILFHFISIQGKETRPEPLASPNEAIQLDILVISPMFKLQHIHVATKRYEAKPTNAKNASFYAFFPNRLREYPGKRPH